MRVAILSKALVVGAYQRKLEELAALPGVELTAIVPPAWRDRRGAVPLDRAHTANYTLRVARLWFNGQYHLHFYPGIAGLLRRIRPEILHVDEEPYNLATWHALRTAQAIGTRGLFFTWQNLDRRYPWPFSHFERANYRRATHAIAGNQAAAQVLRAKGYQGPLSVIPQFGVDPEIFAPGKEGHAGFHVGYAGGLVPEKGVEQLLRACAGLATQNWSLQVAGDGPERERLQTLAEELSPGRVVFHERWPSTRMPEFYHDLDVLVLPSLSRPNWTEQFGRVLVEAMACGIPVIGSSSGEIPNVIGDAGLVYAEGDVGALRTALVGLAEDSALRQDLARRGRERVLMHFTQAQIARATYRVYQQIMGLA